VSLGGPTHERTFIRTRSKRKTKAINLHRFSYPAHKARYGNEAQRGMGVQVLPRRVGGHEPHCGLPKGTLRKAHLVRPFCDISGPPARVRVIGPPPPRPPHYGNRLQSEGIPVPNASCGGTGCLFILCQEARAAMLESWQFGSKLYCTADHISLLDLHHWLIHGPSALNAQP